MTNVPQDQREWYQKKRFIIPGVILGYILLTGGDSSTPATTTVPTAQVAPTKVAPAPIAAPTAREITPISRPLETEFQARTSYDNSDPDLSNDNYYTNVDGDEIHSPAYSIDGDVPAGASAQCHDGTYSFSANRRGTCSGHGGVAEWL
jgi:hypothetical protein